MAAPAAETTQLVVNVSSESGNFFHGNLVNASIACLIELCLFIEQHVHKRGKKVVKKPAASANLPHAQNQAAGQDGEALQAAAA